MAGPNSTAQQETDKLQSQVAVVRHTWKALTHLSQFKCKHGRTCAIHSRLGRACCWASGKSQSFTICNPTALTQAEVYGFALRVFGIEVLLRESMQAEQRSKALGSLTRMVVLIAEPSSFCFTLTSFSWVKILEALHNTKPQTRQHPEPQSCMLY